MVATVCFSVRVFCRSGKVKVSFCHLRMAKSLSLETSRKPTVAQKWHFWRVIVLQKGGGSPTFGMQPWDFCIAKVLQLQFRFHKYDTWKTLYCCKTTHSVKCVQKEMFSSTGEFLRVEAILEVATSVKVF